MTDTVRLTPDWAPRTALLTFDRPEALNAVNDAVLDDLEAALAPDEGVLWLPVQRHPRDGAALPAAV